MSFELLNSSRSYLTSFLSGPVGGVGPELNGRHMLAVGFQDVLPGVGATNDIPPVVDLDEHVVRSGPLNVVNDLPGRPPLPGPLTGVITLTDPLVRFIGSGNGVAHVLILSMSRY
jgi:hypothetical protein